MALSQLTLLPDSISGFTGTFYFLSVELPESGMLFDRKIETEEDLLSTGVDLQRWLRVSAQYPETPARTISESSSYAEAIKLARLHNSSARRFCNLSINYGGNTVTNKRVKILSAIARPVIGQTIGGGTTIVSAAASVITDWIWKSTQDET